MTSLPQWGKEISALVNQGGWVFLALLALAFGIAFALLSLHQAIRFSRTPILKPAQWRSLLLANSNSASAYETLSHQVREVSDPERLMQEIGQRLFAKSERRFAFAFILISAAPLVGLLGTVSGMFSTFRGMATATASAPIDVISDGISEALITTQTGLIIGIPTFIVCAWLKSRHNELLIRFRQLESRILQSATP